MECDEFHEILFLGDANRDGTIGLYELSNVFDYEPGCCGQAGEECVAIMNHYDNDGDGELNHEEMLVAVNDQRFERGFFDPDFDGDSDDDDQDEDQWKADLHQIIETNSQKILDIVQQLQDGNF